MVKKIYLIMVVLIIIGSISVLAPPTITSLALNSTNVAANDTNQNLTAYPVFDADYVKVLYNWFKDEQSISILNMPFEKVNESNSNNAWDYSPYSNSGTENGGVYWNATAGDDGNGSYYFDGAGDYISIADSSIWDTGDKITVSAWIKTNESDQTGKGLIVHDNSNYKWLLYFTGGSSSDSIQFYVRTASGVTAATCSKSEGTVADNNWHLLTGIYDQNTNNARVKIFYDGNECNKAAGYDEAITAGDEGVHIGRWSINYFKGFIDEVLVFNRTLSDLQIKALYNKDNDLVVSDETNANENWKVQATPNDGNLDGATVVSNSVTILDNVIPVINSLVLNSTNLLTNGSNENLTSYVDSSDANNDDVEIIYNWFEGDAPISILNMPFSKVNNTDSDNAWDYSFESNPGTEQNSVNWVSNRDKDSRGTYLFDGTNDFLSIADSNIWDTGDKITVSAWIKANESDQTGKGIVMHDNSNYKWLLYFTGGASSDSVQFLVRTASGVTSAVCTYSEGAVADDSWHYLTGTYDQSLGSERVKMYFDGTECDTTDGYDEAITSGDEGVYVGRWSGGYYEGFIDNVVVFNTTLSQEQIYSSYNNEGSIIVSNETNQGDIWKVSATPNDGKEDGITVESNSVTVGADTVDCGTITTDTNLNQDLSSPGTCFTIGADNIILDCLGYSITYSTAGTLGYGIDNSGGYDNVTVKNCAITEGNSATNNKYAIYSLNGAEMNVESNTITTIGNSAYGVYLVSSSNSTAFGNTITSSGSSANGIALSSSQNSVFYDNNVTTSGTSAKGIYLSQAHGASLYRNNIETSSSSSYGLWLSLNSNSTFFSNNLTTTGSGSFGVSLESSSENNVFLNNSIFSSQENEISDTTGNSYLNYLIYNNSFGEIYWTDSSNDGFLKNLTFDGEIGFNNNLLIGDNVIALNSEAFSGNINSSANITLKGLSFTLVNKILRVENYTTNSNDILNSGTNCELSSCSIISYTNNNLLFETDYFSSFTATDNREIDIYNLSLVNTNSLPYATYRFFIRNVDILSQLINWGLDTDDGFLESSSHTNLSSNENVFVFVEHDYSSGGSYIATANATSSTDYDEESDSFIIG